MAKFKLKKQSKRQPARQRYKIEKRVREHNRKVRRDAKKNPKNKKKPVIQVPNICPFKEDILKEVEAMKKQKEEERKQRREAAKMEKQKTKEQNGGGLESLVENAEMRGKLHDTFKTGTEGTNESGDNKDRSLKAYYREFKKVVQEADVILEVLDARDPLGTRCNQVEEAVAQMSGNKRLVLVLNKADLVPREILNSWLKYLRKSLPTVPFKASTQAQSKKLGQKKFKQTKTDKALQSSTCVGAEYLLSILANYCRNKGIKTSIRVGVVGLPNVGKSSLINSLKRSRACSVGATPGVTKTMQEVQLDSKIKLLDSPGIVFASGSDSSACLRNAVKVSALEDPIVPANAILQRVTKQQMMEMYSINEYNTPDEFYGFKAARMGRFKKGGVPDKLAAARSLVEDWNSGKIKYYTIPPEEKQDDVHISSEIVTETAKEFDINNFEAMEIEMLNNLGDDKAVKTEGFVVDTLGPVNAAESMEEDTDLQPGEKELLSKEVSVETAKKEDKKPVATQRKKRNPEMELEGNLQLNQVRKLQFKKEKKKKNREEKAALQLSAGLESFKIKNQKEEGESYDFDQDFAMS